MKEVNVLIYPAGSESAMEVYYSLKYNPHFNVFGATRDFNHAEYIYPKDKLYFGTLQITDAGFFDELNHVLAQFAIDYIIPTHDTVTPFLMEHQDKINARMICSPCETAKIAENKKLTYQALNGCDFNLNIYEDIDRITKYPVFLKPCIGSGSAGVCPANNPFELQQILAKNPNMLICEYLPGPEYTIDCFTNKKNELLFIGPRKRGRVTSGIAHHSERVEDNREFERIARELNNRFHFRGAWFFQVKEDEKGRLKLMEFSVRQAGTMALYRQLGVNFAALSLYDAMGHDVRILFNDYKIVLDRCLDASYRLDYPYEKLYLDLENTLIIMNKVNTALVKLLYQCVNEKKKIILLAQSDHDLSELFDRYRINRMLFDEIVLLAPGVKKVDIIDPAKSILIDHSFSERELVKHACHIPVFDVDAVGCLLDHTAI